MQKIAYKYRGEIIDLIHYGDIVVSDYKGKILCYAGDIEKMTFARSSLKPIQAISIVESGAADYYKITDKELAIMCASHNGEPIHIQTITKILEKSGLTKENLTCSVAYPMYAPAENELKSNNIPRSSIFCDCSGKHSGMLITAKHNHENLDNYHSLNHPVQQRIINTVADICDVNVKDIKIAIDGCGVPVHALPLKIFAKGFARMTMPELFENNRSSAINRITNAMTQYPYMVAGANRFCTELMDAFGDRLFGKSGAGAFYGIGIKNKGIGIVVKMTEGTSNIIPYAVLETLIHLKVITRKEAESLPCYNDKNVYNGKKEIVGKYEPVLKLIDM